MESKSVDIEDIVRDEVGEHENAIPPRYTTWSQSKNRFQSLSRHPPDITILPHSSDKIFRFRLSNVDVHIANALRQACMRDVPTLAMHRVLVHTNISNYHNEWLQERLQFVPLHVADSVGGVLHFNPFEECPCRPGRIVVPGERKTMVETTATRMDKSTTTPPTATPHATPPPPALASYQFCPRCTVKFELNVDYSKAPSHAEDRLVTTHDLQCYSPEIVTPIHDGETLLFKLHPGGHVHLTMFAIRGTGLQHAKFMPVTRCGFKYIPSIKISPRVQSKWTAKQKSKLVQSCPKRFFILDEKGVGTTGTATIGASTSGATNVATTGTAGTAPPTSHNPTVRVVSPQDCIFCGRCTEYAYVVDKSTDSDVVVQTLPREYDFTVESTMAWSKASDIVSYALTTLIDLCHRTSTEVTRAVDADAGITAANLFQ